MVAAASPHPGQPSCSRTTTSCVTLTDSSLPTSIMRMSLGDVLRAGRFDLYQDGIGLLVGTLQADHPAINFLVVGQSRDDVPTVVPGGKPSSRLALQRHRDAR